MSKFDTSENFQAHCKAQESTILSYVEMNKKNYQQLDADTLGQLSREQIRYFHANNFSSRLRFTQSLIGQIDRFIADNDVRSVRFVTLTPDIFATDEEDATTFDVEVLKRWVDEYFPGFDYIGIVEAAFYPAWPAGRPTISWHVHMLTFDMPYRRFLSYRAAINAAYRSLVPGVNAAEAQQVSIRNLPYKVRYMLKFPSYRYRPSPITVKSPAMSGGPARIPTGRFGQSKDDLRTGELIRMCRVLAQLGLDQLLFAGGAGKAVIAPVIAEASAAMRHDEDLRSR